MQTDTQGQEKSISKFNYHKNWLWRPWLLCTNSGSDSIWYVRKVFYIIFSLHCWNAMSSIILMTLRNSGLETYATFQKHRKLVLRMYLKLCSTLINQMLSVWRMKMQLENFVLCMIPFSKRSSLIHWSEGNFAFIN